MKLVSPEVFIEAAQPVFKEYLQCIGKKGGAAHRRWMACSGAKPEVMSSLWGMIDPDVTMPLGSKPVHMTWALFYLKSYPTEEVLSRCIGGSDEKTCRKWIWLFVDAISFQEYRVVRGMEKFNVY